VNYPVWELTCIGGGTLMAVISILHVYVAHLAVGGGMYLWLTDLKSSRENDQELVNFLREHTWFFLLLTMVFGAVTGVGIWFTISLINPSGTSVLIHNFVFAWAIEWVFFLVEIVSLLVYYYRFDRLDIAARQRIAFIYFMSAWLSLFAVNGILSFMLTPGKWIETQNFWHGFFNPSFVPSTLLRTALSAMFAGIFSFTTTMFTTGGALRERMIAYSKKWLMYPSAVLIPLAIWTYFSLPAEVRETGIHINPQSIPSLALFLAAYLTVLMMPGYIEKPESIRWRKTMTCCIIAAGLFLIGGFEYLREISRKPFVIRDYLYSSSIKAGEDSMSDPGGILSKARWTIPGILDEKTMEQAGREIFNLECLSCHTINGVRNDIVSRIRPLTYEGLMSQLDGQGSVLDYMPPFIGTETEKKALARYLHVTLGGGSIPDDATPVVEPLPDVEIPPFNPYSDRYVLLAWSDRGMNLVSDCDRWFVLLPPDTTIRSMLVARGNKPAIMAGDVSIMYASGPEYAQPSKRSDFWVFSGRTMGRRIKRDKGITGFSTDGSFKFEEQSGLFTASSVPIVPFTASGLYDPHPVITVSAFSQNEEKPIMVTKFSAAVSAEFGCSRCHGGWKETAARAGISDETAANILKAHDRIGKTRLYREAASGSPKSCGSCHEDAATGIQGKPGSLSLSASIHGFHANYIHDTDAGACMKCHLGGPGSKSKSSRGIHETVGISCVECHGSLDLHALALLKGQQKKKSADRLAKHLKKRSSLPLERIQARKAWVQQPGCLTCHAGFDAPSAYDGFNAWNKDQSGLFRNSTDNVGVPCQACHGPAHALYPVKSGAGNRDAAQPLQYTGSPYPIGSDRKCQTCHTVPMNESAHHENMLRMFRNR